jgi:hypothetical protein
MTSQQTVARLPARRDNASACEAVDPRLEPFLRELAHMLWRDVKRQLQNQGKETRP